MTVTILYTTDTIYGIKKDVRHYMEIVMDIRGAAQFLGGLSLQTIRKWCSQRFIPYVKLGRRVLFRLSDLEKFLEENLVNPKR